MVNVCLRKRYLMVFKDGTTEILNLNPEEKYYFEEQETRYLVICIDSLKKENFEKYKNLLYIQPIFISTDCEEYRISIGV